MFKHENVLCMRIIVHQICVSHKTSKNIARFYTVWGETKHCIITLRVFVIFAWFKWNFAHIYITILFIKNLCKYSCNVEYSRIFVFKPLESCIDTCVWASKKIPKLFKPASFAVFWWENAGSEFGIKLASVVIRNTRTFNCCDWFR